MAKKAGKRTARPTKKAAPRRRTLDLKEVQAAMERTELLRSLREKISELDAAHSSLKDVQRRLLQAFL